MKEKKPIVCADIVRKLFVEYVYAKKSLYCVDGMFVWNTNFESDFFAVTKAGFQAEFEIKVSRSDFKADFKKAYSKYKGMKKDANGTNRAVYESAVKHEMIADGRSGLKNFYFCTPKGLLTLEDIPEYAGLMEFERNTYGQVRLRIIKRAPSLTKPAKLTDARRDKIMESMKWRYYRRYLN